MLWSVGGSLSQPLLEGGKLKAGVDFAQAGYVAAQASYRQTVLTAFQEVQNAVTGLSVLADAAQQAAAAVDDARKLVSLAQDRYAGGLTPFIDVLTAQQQLLTSERQAVQIQGQRAALVVFLAKALGGGWDGQAAGGPAPAEVATAAPVPARPRRTRLNRITRTTDSNMKVLIVEDEPKVVEYLKSGLTEEGWVVDTALDGEDGAWKAVEFDYDVVVLDVMLPKLDGFGVLRALRAQKQTPVIMLTARDRVDDRVRGLRGGADDYLTKPFSFLELIERLRALTRRARVQESTLISIGDLRVDLIGRRATRDGTRLDLTAQEFQLLGVLARRSGEVLSKTTIAELVWDVNFDSNANVVETAIKRLRAKLDGPFTDKLLHTIRGMGYVLEAREDGDTERPA